MLTKLLNEATRGVAATVTPSAVGPIELASISANRCAHQISSANPPSPTGQSSNNSKEGAPAYINRNRRPPYRKLHRRPNPRDPADNTPPGLGDGVEQSRLRGAVGLEPVGNGPGLARGERGGRGALGAEVVEDGGDVFEAFADLLHTADVLVSDGLQ